MRSRGYKTRIQISKIIKERYREKAEKGVVGGKEGKEDEEDEGEDENEGRKDELRRSRRSTPPLEPPRTGYDGLIG